MNEQSNALRILKEERIQLGVNLPEDLLERVYRIEFKVQFDDTRKDVLYRLKDAINTVLDAEALRGASDGDAF